MNNDQFERLLEAVKNGFWWICFWLFILVFVQACSGPSSNDMEKLTNQVSLIASEIRMKQ